VVRVNRGRSELNFFGEILNVALDILRGFSLLSPMIAKTFSITPFQTRNLFLHRQKNGKRDLRK
jgi:hypothetical protein